MQKWEFLKVTFSGEKFFYEPLYRPSSIRIWPPGIIDLEKFAIQFEVRIASTDLVDGIDQLFRNAETISSSLIQYLGQSGWEPYWHVALREGEADYSRTIYFKRPMED